MTRRDRTIALVKVDSPEALADSIAAAVGGAALAVSLLEAAARYLRGEP
jgi:hypothetical protein